MYGAVRGRVQQSLETLSAEMKRRDADRVLLASLPPVDPIEHALRIAAEG